ncbi:hypothetical protein PORY_000005 [Pneumocystis oryctolagi]|uniref:Uncharacterized protein n=1 Tax=Pneumocystis oryctolagi TaxID=42067 RepID=A0ACB7CE18_9ASCO|nr:hypothetical protein PORY_000005 [Pneumocystis oryctolagi]
MILGNLGRQLSTALTELIKTQTIDEDALDVLLKKICSALLENDVNVSLVQKLRDNIRNKVKINKSVSITNKKRIIYKTVFDELCELVGSGNEPYSPKKGEWKDDILCESKDTFDAIDMPDTFDSSLPYTTDSQNRPYLKSFESLEYTQHLSEILDPVDSICKKSEDFKTLDSTLGTCHASPIKNCSTSSSNMNAQTKGETLDAAINDISMNRIFNFSEFPKKSLNIENDNDQSTFLEDTVSSIYHITNDNNIKFPNFQTDMFSKSDSIFNDNISNISANKHEDQADGNNEIIVFKGEKSDKEVSLKDIQYDEISVNYASQQLKSLPPSEKVSTWLSHNESMQLEIFDDIRSQISTSTINIHRDQLNCTEYDCSAMCVPVDSEFLSETEKDNVSLESGISGEKMSGKYDSDVSASYTCDNFLVSFRSIRNRSHVYFFGIEMNRIQREMYLQLILQYNDLIQEFCSLSNPDKALVKKVYRFMNILTMLTIHPYLFCSLSNPDKALVKKVYRFMNILTMLTIHPYLAFLHIVSANDHLQS